jgi:hypothetical protein
LVVGVTGPVFPNIAPGPGKQVRPAAYNDPGAQIARQDRDTRQFYPTPEVGPRRTEQQQAPEDKFHRDFPSTPPRTHQWVPDSPKNQGGVESSGFAPDHFGMGFEHGRALAPQIRANILDAIDVHLVNSFLEQLRMNGFPI